MSMSGESKIRRIDDKLTRAYKADVADWKLIEKLTKQWVAAVLANHREQGGQ